MKIKTTTAFRALNARRSAERDANKKWAVKSVNKDGSVSKMAPLSIHESQEKADADAARLATLNPKSSFTVIELP